MLIVPLSFCSRPWALPFMTVLASSKKANAEANKHHKTSIDWTILMMKLVCRWLGDRTWFLIGEGGYACKCLARACMHKGVTLISRLRLDAQLYECPEPQPEGKRGRKPTKGKRIQLKDLVDDDTQDWQTREIKWYGNKKKTLNLLSKTCLWYQAGYPPIPLRYVLVVDPANEKNPEVFCSTNADLSMEKIIEYFVMRWNIEVTFEEAREHLGMETQRQWSDRAIARTTPLLLGLYSVVTLCALKLKEIHALTPLSTAWYQKNDEVTFSDAIAFVRRIIRAHRYFPKSAKSGDLIQIPKIDLNSLINQLAG